MAWENITHSCGHEARHQLYGKRADRERKAAWLAENPCTECWKAEQEAKRAEENARASEKAQELGLPELTGSPKQIAWATTIRQKAMETLTNDLKKIQQPERPCEAMAIDIVALEKSAGWWIDNKKLGGDSYGKEILLAMMKQNPEGMKAIEEKYN